MVQRLLIDPTAGVIAASITDGTDVVDAEWAIRRPAPELSVAPGRVVVLEGVTRVEGDGRLVIIPASFHVSSFPEIA